MADMNFEPTVKFLDVEGVPVAYDSKIYWCRRFDQEGSPRYNLAVAIKNGTPISETEFREMLPKSEA
jgi:hypothetical protein